MTTSTQAHAALAIDAYKTYSPDEWKKGVVVDGVQYQILDQTSGRSGYQGTIYQRVDTKEIIVAHRGTEFDKQLVKDGIVADGGMVLAGVNSQSGAAIAFTQRAIDLANVQNAGKCEVPSITVTGHSLGGTLAQISAHKFGLQGETFNAYGAAGLTADLPRGGTQMVNHVRSTDFVSAASPHFGEVRVYAPQKDVDALQDKGYANDNRYLTDFRRPLGVALGIGVSAHYGDNFKPKNELLGTSVISDENRARYEEYKPMIDKYRTDVRAMHNTMALPRNTVDAVVDTVTGAAQGVRDLVRGKQPPEAPPAGYAPAACATPSGGAAIITDPSHPGHVRFQQAMDGIRSSPNIPPGTFTQEQLPQVAAAVAASSLSANLPLRGIETVVLNSDKTALIAIEGRPPDNPANKTVSVSVAQAQGASLEASSQTAQIALQGQPAVQQQAEQQRQAQGR
jgi:hypothetical protein